LILSVSDLTSEVMPGAMPIVVAREQFAPAKVISHCTSPGGARMVIT
jgi:hypothetical protein